MARNDDKASLSRGARRRARYREIAAVLWDERVINLFKGSGLDEHAPPQATGRGHDPDIKEKELPRAVRIRHALERLGPAFIKAGQILATRRDLVTPDLAEELSKLQDDVPTLPWEEIKARIEEEL
jgi:ubiquinone biosynthesis protein